MVISALDGVQAHTRTIWQLLDRYHIPTFIFVNKMDIAHDSKEELLAELQQELDPHCVQFYPHNDARDEEAALCDDDMLERFLAQGSLQEEELTALIRERRLFRSFRLRLAAGWCGSAAGCAGCPYLHAGVSGGLWRPDLQGQQ
ncbi:MAG: GTP-binding protein [Merdibacter sp.]